MIATPFLTTLKGHSSLSHRSTSSRISPLSRSPSRRSPAVALTATGVQLRSLLGTFLTASSSSIRNDSAASRGRPAYDDKPGVVWWKPSSSSLGSEPGVGSQCEKV